MLIHRSTGPRECTVQAAERSGWSWLCTIAQLPFGLRLRSLGEDKGAPPGAWRVRAVRDQGPRFKGIVGGNSSGHFHNSLHAN